MGMSQYAATLPATGDGVLAARLLARAAAVCCPRRDDVEFVVGEIAACAIRDSGDGEFTVIAVRRRDRGWLHVEALRAEGDWCGGEDSWLAHSYGLMIVDALADRWGSFTVPDTGAGRPGTAATWAELTWR